VTGIEFGSGAVTGAWCDSGSEPALERADFAVDAMGRSTRLSHWLEEAAPPVQRIRVATNYLTAASPPGH
jgi:hypothetical protein